MPSATPLLRRHAATLRSIRHGCCYYDHTRYIDAQSDTPCRRRTYAMLLIIDTFYVFASATHLTRALYAIILLRC